jgi:hypothetical protein
MIVRKPMKTLQKSSSTEAGFLSQNIEMYLEIMIAFRKSKLLTVAFDEVSKN